MDGHTKSPDTEMVEADDLHHVLILLDKMDKREATVLRMRFGLDDEEPKTLKEIGECLGLTRERVRQIESEALSKLQREHGSRVTPRAASRNRHSPSIHFFHSIRHGPRGDNPIVAGPVHAAPSFPDPSR